MCVFMRFMCVQRREPSGCSSLSPRLCEGWDKQGGGGVCGMYTRVSQGEDPTALYICTKCLSDFLLCCLHVCVCVPLSASEHQVCNHILQS